MIIGRTSDGYPEQRNIAYTSQYGFDTYLVEDRITYLKKGWHRLSGVGYSALLHSFSFPKASNVGIVHTFNSIVASPVPWVVTYETSLPREKKLPKFLTKYAWNRLAKSECRGIIALSDCAKDQMLSDLEENRANLDLRSCDSIRAKLQVIHPPQDILYSTEEKEKEIGFDGPLRLALVGHDFYRKGGLEILLALDVLIQEGKDIHLSIAGGMRAGDYASRAGRKEVALANNLIVKHHKNVKLLGGISSKQVLALLKRSHIICLPTWADTYGYSVLEGQASGCAAITTDIRALTEINDLRCGWVITVPKLHNGDGDLGSAEKRRLYRKILTEGLCDSLRSAFEDRNVLRRKSRASIARIRDFHSPEAHAEKLYNVYQR